MSGQSLTGHRISPGLAAGPLWILDDERNGSSHHSEMAHKASAVSGSPAAAKAGIGGQGQGQGPYAKGSAQQEVERVDSAVQRAVDDLNSMAATADTSTQREIFEAHALMAQDPEWLEKIHALILGDGLSAPVAVDQATKEFAAAMAALDDEYLRERAHDIEDVGRRVKNHLLGTNEERLLPEKGEYILVARNLTPSQFAALDKKRVLGLITEVGGVSSHTAIMARLYEIPALSGVDNATERLKSLKWAFLNADKSFLLAEPEGEDRSTAEVKVNEFRREKQELFQVKALLPETKDGVAVKLEANIGRESDLNLVEKYGAQGVGLFRTEFLFFDRPHAPSEDEQARTYSKVARALAPHDVVIRTFDIGADKQVPYIQWPKEENPFLGLRALRYCLKDQHLFRVQLRALLRASSETPLSIMFPMVSCLEELEGAREILKAEEACVRDRGLNPKYRLGIMVEVPSIALVAEKVASQVDFFSIGTNDLIQYVCAVDRMNETVTGLYDSYHPGVLRLVSEVIQAGQRNNVEVAMCGEMAADLNLIPLLLGMGLRVFSQSPATVLRSKRLIRSLSAKDCGELAARAMVEASGRRVQALCQEFLSSLTLQK